MARARALLSAICKCMVEPVSSSSSEVLLPSRCLHRAATALETCSSDSLDSAAAFAGDFAFFEPLLGAGDLAFLELLGGTAAGGAFAFFALGTGAAAAGVAAVSATLRFFGFSAGVGVAVAGSLTPFRFVGLSAFAGAGLLGMVGRPRGKVRGSWLSRACTLRAANASRRCARCRDFMQAINNGGQLLRTPSAAPALG